MDVFSTVIHILSQFRHFIWPKIKMIDEQASVSVSRVFIGTLK